jgi:malic enzyme
MGLHTVVEQVKPTILIGCSTAQGAFTQQVVETMSAGTRRPVIFQPDLAARGRAGRHHRLVRR